MVCWRGNDAIDLAGREQLLTDERDHAVCRYRSGVEEFSEWACGQAGSEFAAVAGVFEEVDVDVERDRGACVSEDAADLRDIEGEVEDESSWAFCSCLGC